MIFDSILFISSIYSPTFLKHYPIIFYLSELGFTGFYN